MFCMLKEGTIAPDFTLTNVEGKQVKLSDFRGKKIMLSLFRDTSCPICNLRVNELIKNQELFKNGKVHVISIFPSSVERIKKYTGKQEPDFELLANPDKEVYKAYEVVKSPGKLIRGALRISRMFKAYKAFFSLRSIFTPAIIPAEFLIDEEGKIIKAHYGKDFTEHLPMNEIRDRLSVVTPYGDVIVR